ncbi:hypothetical protein M1247_30495 [Mycobacterium sp. 21AC1]|uniref:hypothetical protein n=1 Tax=[Mycobacterium] appelbergii TaxID=2939269 RepID=UPI00293907EA|nr:hypothetical protein [Mycobacterium sp. 21AC1]MDV3129269.1 hypothetical protein [Mycobacterium sp. 21AC1]
MSSSRVSGQMRFVQVVVVVAALSMLITGVWMRIDPASFARWANWPNHVHFLHDAGVFQIGIGMTMVFALWWRDVIAVVLTGFLVANTLHAINHFLDTDGGNAADWWQLGVFSLLAGAGIVVRLRQIRSRNVQSSAHRMAALR